MTNTIKELAAIIIVVAVLASIVGISAILLSHETAECVETKETVEVFVDERLKNCQDKGGVYSLFYNDYAEEYRERCMVTSKEIENF